MSNKTARCWGQGSNYQLGTGSVSSVYNPTGVWINGNQTPLTGVLAVTAGYAHSCALVEQTVPPGPNTVACWGYNNSGQIGDGSTTNMPFPATVRIDADNTLQNAVAVKAGDYHTCALLANGSLWCWGQNTYGQVGNGTLTNQLFAVQVSGISSPLSFSAGQYSSCAVTAGGGVKCWGWDNYGELGDLYWSAFPLDVGM
jgi:alpha-tubulin suppressor-like RCC1 family protein